MYLNASRVYFLSFDLMAIATAVNSSETTTSLETVIIDKEMMTIVTIIVRSSETMMTMNTLISSKEMMTIVSRSETMMTMKTIISCKKIMTIVTIISSNERMM